MTIMYRPNPRLAWREIEGEMVLIEPSTGRVVVLNTTGSTIWTLLESGKPSDAIAERVATDHGIPEETARRDVELFVEDLKSRSFLVEASEEGALS